MDKAISHTLQTLHKQQQQSGNPTWNIDEPTGRFLASLVLAKQCKRVLEIGTSVGISALWFALALRETGGTLVTVESHDERFAEATNNFLKAGAEGIISQVKGHAPEVLDDIPGEFDLMFFDATKCEHLSYISALAPRLQHGGVVITDNIDSHADTLNVYRDAMEADEQFFTSHLPVGTGLLISVKV